MWKGKVFPVVVRILLTLFCLGIIAQAIEPADENDPLVQAVDEYLCPAVSERSFNGMDEIAQSLMSNIN
jgi:hypothetical protein